MFVLGIAGKARSGKDTCARWLVEEAGFTRYAFADPLKETINPLFGWGDRHSDGDLKEVEDPFWQVSPRRAYQLFGTEFARQLIRDDFWLKRAEMAISGLDRVVIPDVRFNNEADWVRERGLLIHIWRPVSESVSSHSSEDGVWFSTGDQLLGNIASIEDLKAKLDSMLASFRERGQL